MMVRFFVTKIYSIAGGRYDVERKNKKSPYA